jgi:hypothetical protein
MKVVMAAVGLTAIGVFGTAEGVRAFAYEHCSGDPVVLQSTPVTWKVLSGTMTTGAHGDVDYAIAEWNALVGMQNIWSSSHTHPFENESIPPVPDSTFSIFAATNLPAEFYGKMWPVYNKATCPGRRIVEADIGFQPNLGLISGNVDCDNAGVATRTVVLHELGHALGLDHPAPGWGVMMGAGDTPSELGGVFKYCGNTTKHIWLGPDDTAGGRYLYPGTGTNRDLAATSWEYIDQDETNFLDFTSPSAEPVVCPGQSVTFEWAVINLGNVAVNGFNTRFYLSTDKTISTADTLIQTWVGSSMCANCWGKQSMTLTIPWGAAPLGSIRYLGWIMDYDNQFAETNESNNWAYIEKPIRICSL